MANYSDEEIQRLLEQGVIRGVVLENGEYRYIYIGDVKPRTTRATTSRTGGGNTVRYRQESLL